MVASKESYWGKSKTNSAIKLSASNQGLASAKLMFFSGIISIPVLHDPIDE